MCGDCGGEGETAVKAGILWVTGGAGRLSVDACENFVQLDLSTEAESPQPRGAVGKDMTRLRVWGQAGLRAGRRFVSAPGPGDRLLKCLNGEIVKSCPPEWYRHGCGRDGMGAIVVLLVAGGITVQPAPSWWSERG